MSRREALWVGAALTGLGVITGCATGAPRPLASIRLNRLGFVSVSTPNAEFEQLRSALRENGYAEGANLEIAYRFSSDPSALGAYVAELGRWGADVLVVVGSNVVRAVMRAEASIPIVMIANGDPVRAGLVGSLSRPGGRVTGVSTFDAELNGKRLELLQGLVPGVSRVGVVYEAAAGEETFEFSRLLDAAAQLRLDLLDVPIRSGGTWFLGPIEAARAQGCSALLVPQQQTPYAEDALIRAATSLRLPALYAARGGVAAGLLASYGPRLSDVYARAATFVDRILRGARPADLPVEQPTTFDLVINLKTATDLGLSIPPGILQQSTEVLQ